MRYPALGSPVSPRSFRVADGHDRRDLPHAYLGPSDRCGNAVHGRGKDGLVERAIYDDSTRGHPYTGAEIDRDNLADRAHVVVDWTVLGAQVRDDDSWVFLDPLV